MEAWLVAGGGLVAITLAWWWSSRRERRLREEIWQQFSQQFSQLNRGQDRVLHALEAMATGDVRAVMLRARMEREREARAQAAGLAPVELDEHPRAAEHHPQFVMPFPELDERRSTPPPSSPPPAAARLPLPGRREPVRLVPLVKLVGNDDKTPPSGVAQRKT